ncbi:bifunctional ornithine acetyltransferase/N-acetylglutamate synthase [Sutcliffiella horikoshii]|uniref:Arginine biosynthesis bifunctional protein ArgJ n=1 Tax=Sutcliffiella horikoshii TaxID=79883 RepID=A0A5D4SG25_9BACI|nr:bifunctional ornithine acetyltransferase/N-acetylglutamate synthase [Sutcliffiella horikoshii]TYS62567.1 bifunctional ornithine acetyltransferase/N-acetylglutamate synthase [Sutcliffiella horikoshii]
MKVQVIPKKEKWIAVEQGNICTPKGFSAGGLHCGIKRKRKDLGWIYSEVPATAAAVYTTNQFQAPPLKVSKESINTNGALQGVIVNSGNANSCTGKLGLQNAYKMREIFAEKACLKENDVAVISTGVIGEQLPINKIVAGVESISTLVNDAISFEEAILTTDTFTKHICLQLETENKVYTIAGAAKGSGMVHPKMATMLGFVTTDINIHHDILQKALKEVTEETFNMITVDGDTSTNDMVLVLANGMAGNKQWTQDDDEYALFKEGLHIVCQSLSQQIARDGEGATKLIEVQVNGAETVHDAQVIAKTIVGSSLVKTAVFGQDPNWGRIVSALGYSGITINTEKIKLKIGPVLIVEDGMPVSFCEEEAKSYLKNEKIEITVDLHAGNEIATAWGCDLSYDYVRINASYRT